jgi:hypothetical protein
VQAAAAMADCVAPGACAAAVAGRIAAATASAAVAAVAARAQSTILALGVGIVRGRMIRGGFTARTYCGNRAGAESPVMRD